MTTTTTAAFCMACMYSIVPTEGAVCGPCVATVTGDGDVLCAECDRPAAIGESVLFGEAFVCNECLTEAGYTVDLRLCDPHDVGCYCECPECSNDETDPF